MVEKKNNFFGFSKPLLFVVVLTIFTSIMGIVINICTAELFASMVVQAEEAKLFDLIKSAGLFIILNILFYIIHFFVEYVINYRSAVGKQNLKLKIYDALYQCPIWYIKEKKLGDLRETFSNDISTYTTFFLTDTPLIVSGVISVIVYLVYILKVDMLLCVLIFLISLLQIIPPVIYKRLFEKNYIDTRNIEGEITNHLEKGFQSLSLIKMFSIKRKFLDGLTALNEEYYRVSKKTLATGWAEKQSRSFISSMLSYGSYLLVAIFVLFNKLDLSEAAGVITLISSFYGGVAGIIASLPNYFVARKAFQRISQLFLFKVDNIKNQNIINDISVNGVSVSYSDGTKIEYNDIKIVNGEKIALVGSNGTGKTTLINCLMGWINQYDGLISINGNNLREIDIKSCYEHISYLFQEDYVSKLCFNDIVEMFQPETFDKLSAYSYLEKLGFEESLCSSPLSELSGGERKKALIVCSLCRKVDFIILDEPTNSLDSETNKMLRDIIAQIDKTFIIITHDTKLQDICDRTIILK